MTSIEGRDLPSVEFVNLAVDKQLTANVELVTNSLQLANGAGSGFVLASNAAGQASWQSLTFQASFNASVVVSGPWDASQNVVTTMSFRKVGPQITLGFPSISPNANVITTALTNNFVFPDATWLSNSSIEGLPATQVTRPALVVNNGKLVVGRVTLTAAHSAPFIANVRFAVGNGFSGNYTNTSVAGFAAQSLTYLDF